MIMITMHFFFGKFLRLNPINNFPELLELGMVRTIEDQALKDEGYKLHAYNILVSNRLEFNRSIPDTRHQL